MSTLRERWRARRDAKRRQCRVTEEWCGSFIGRRYCSTHDYYWDWPERQCRYVGEEPVR